MSESRRQLLSIGVLFIIAVVAILALCGKINRSLAEHFPHNLHSVRGMGTGHGIHACSKPSEIRAHTIRYIGNGHNYHGFRRRLARLQHKLALLPCLANSCARRDSHRFSSKTKETLSHFSALNIFLFQCTVTIAEGSTL